MRQHLPSKNGETVSLSDFVGKTVVLYLPKDDTQVVPNKPVASGMPMLTIKAKIS